MKLNINLTIFLPQRFTTEDATKWMQKFRTMLFWVVNQGAEVQGQDLKALRFNLDYTIDQWNSKEKSRNSNPGRPGLKE